jgi:ABC-type multidrug transport system ATPase subunit
MNLEDARHKRLGAYSGGMKQRILIAQALLGNPEILVFDEPTAGLDPKERIRIRNLISNISLNRIVIVATHVISDVESIADNFFFLKKGVLVEQGNLWELKKKMRGSVHESVIAPEDVPGFAAANMVSNISRELGGVRMRVVSPTPPEGVPSEAVEPSMDDIYLALYGSEDGS